MRVPLFLPHEESMERPFAVMCGRVGTPPLQPFPFGRIIQVLPALGFDDPEFLLARLTLKSGIIRDTAVGIGVYTEHRGGLYPLYSYARFGPYPKCSAHNRAASITFHLSNPLQSYRSKALLKIAFTSGV